MQVFRPLSASLLVLACLLAANPSFPAASASSDPPVTELADLRATTLEAEFVDRINRERRKRKLGELRIEPLLIQVARSHSREMMAKNYFGHRSPTPGRRSPADRYLLYLGYRPDYAAVGENLYYATVIDSDRGHRALMASPTHRENILWPDFEKVGVGIHENALGQFWVTQMFLTEQDPDRKR